MMNNNTIMEQEMEKNFVSASVYVAVLPMLLIIGAEWLRRSVARKISANTNPRQERLIHVQGRVEKGYERIRNAFFENFEKDWEKGGAAVAVYHKGRLVADLWGGYADKDSRRLWREDTLSISFSSTKAVSALCIAVLVDRGLLKYDDLVISFWPEFGKHGKDQVTIQWVLSHMSGLAYLDRPLRFEDALCHPEEIARLFEDQTPNWTPGEFVGYHATTYGWLLDQIVRRVDPQHRSLGQFYKQELANKIEGLEYYIGLPKEHNSRVTRISLPSWRQRLSEFVHNSGAVYYFRYIKDFYQNGMLCRVERTPEWLRFVFEMTLNNPELYQIEQGAVLGIGTARSLAALFQKAIFELSFFGKNTRNLFLTPFCHKPDIVSGANVLRGNGLMFSNFRLGKKEHKMIGHAGVGGQNIKFDPEHELVFAYLSNGLKAGFGDTARTFVALRDSIYESVLEAEAPKKTN